MFKINNSSVLFYKLNDLQQCNTDGRNCSSAQMTTNCPAVRQSRGRHSIKTLNGNPLSADIRPGWRPRETNHSECLFPTFASSRFLEREALER